MDKLGNGLEFIVGKQKGVCPLKPNARERIAGVLQFLQIFSDFLQGRDTKRRVLIIGAKFAGIMGATGSYLQINTVRLVRRTYHIAGKVHNIISFYLHFAFYRYINLRKKQVSLLVSTVVITPCGQIPQTPVYTLRYGGSMSICRYAPM